MRCMRGRHDRTREGGGINELSSLNKSVVTAQASISWVEGRVFYGQIHTGSFGDPQVSLLSYYFDKQNSETSWMIVYLVRQRH